MSHWTRLRNSNLCGCLVYLVRFALLFPWFGQKPCVSCKRLLLWFYSFFGPKWIWWWMRMIQRRSCAAKTESQFWADREYVLRLSTIINGGMPKHGWITRWPTKPSQQPAIGLRLFIKCASSQESRVEFGYRIYMFPKCVMWVGGCDEKALPKFQMKCHQK